MGSRGAADERGVSAARELARELRVLDSVVLFNPGWVPYAERGAWLAQADCAITCHRDHLETRFAFRTRILDCLWAGLPVVCTAGDDLGERVERERLGAVVPGEDPQALADALREVLNRGRGAYAKELAQAAAEYTWPRVAAPLIAWLEDPPHRPRPGRTRGAVAIPLGQRLRTAAYLAGGRLLLDQRAVRLSGRRGRR